MTKCDNSIETEEPVPSCMRYAWAATEANGQLGGLVDDNEAEEREINEDDEASDSNAAQSGEDADMLGHGLEDEEDYNVP